MVLFLILKIFMTVNILMDKDMFFGFNKPASELNDFIININLSQNNYVGLIFISFGVTGWAAVEGKVDSVRWSYYKVYLQAADDWRSNKQLQDCGEYGADGHKLS